MSNQSSHQTTNTETASTQATNTSKPEAKQPLWTPSPERIAEARITGYLNWLKENRGLHFDCYEDLWNWSVTDLEDFWESIWEYGGVISHSPYHRVLNQHTMPGARWFEGSTLNYAENILAHAKDANAASRPAVIAESETRPRLELSWRNLLEQTASLTATLQAVGLQKGDRAVAYMPNIPETAIALFATASLGAIWSAASPDMGVASVLDRFRQIEPKVLFTIDGYRYNDKDYDRREVVIELVKQLPSLETVIFLPYLNPINRLDLSAVAERTSPTVITFVDAINTLAEPVFTPVAFDHPLWIVYSSGTTGMPKPIIHCHGGVVIQTLKAGMLHADAKADSRNFWFTSTSWIMWNSVINGLFSGATIMLFDGNPAYPDLTTLWRYAEREQATFFGTSPAFINLCMKAGLNPRAQFDLSNLKTVGSTGSPLSEEGYRWVYEKVHPDVMLHCISGGTDPGACFLTSCPLLPTYAGEMSCRELGVAAYAFNDAGQPVTNEVGELVMVKPIPSMPTGFWGDEDGSRYFESYFDTYPGVWRHGDWVEFITRPESVTGIVYGRSDATINRHGIRMGTSEIYRVVENFPEVLDSLVVDLEYLGKPSYMALFIVLKNSAQVPNPSMAGKASTSDKLSAALTGVPLELKTKITAAIRTQLSARHTPNEVFAIAAVPRTISGKKMEVPVKKILLGKEPEKSANRDSMANPESLNWFVEFANSRNNLGRG